MSTQQSNTAAALNLQQFDRPIGVTIIPAGQTWKDRQQVQYAALKGLLKEDFHGLADFNEQMEMYSRTNLPILYKAWMVVKPMVPLNRKILQSLVMNTRLGMFVGKLLSSILGFDATFVLPTSILEDTDGLKQRLML